MNRSAITPPKIDPTSIFEHYRGSYGSELLTAAVTHFDIFARLGRQPAGFTELREELGLSRRAAVVLFTALRAMGLLEMKDGKLRLSDIATEHLLPGSPFDVGDYIGLAAQSPGVITMVELLRTNKPLSFEGGGNAFIYRDGIESAMDSESLARHFTLALSGRAKNVAPLLAKVLDTSSASTVIDVGGGTGIYSYALLQKNPNLRAIVLDRPEVLNVAEEMAEEYGVADRTELVAADMFTDEIPNGDLVLLSNILHDWDVSECKQLIARCAQSLNHGGRVAIHDVFLNDQHDGPLPIALYSAALFTLTEGRAYSELEYTQWLHEANLKTSRKKETLVHCGVLVGQKV